MLKQDVERCPPAQAEELYGVGRWSNGYFSINAEGHVVVHPDRHEDRSIDLKNLVDQLSRRGLDLPLLIRFDDVLTDRLSQIQQSFQTAIDDHDYQSNYQCIYPIKVNQQRQVVERVLKHSQPSRIGIEAGSKPELLASIALVDDDRPIICNGFKDRRFIETALMAQKIGRTVLLVVEKRTELDLILEISRRMSVRPQIGIRVKLAARGAGRWQSSAGYQSKFGLTITETLDSLEQLEILKMADCLQLVHFHLGSQVTNIRYIKAALIEAARIYSDLVCRGAGLKYLDVGGGLGVDYDGSQSSRDSSVDYSLQEYANDVIYHVQTVCDETKVPHPVILTESGRAIAAYHSVLVFEVLGVSQQDRNESLIDLPANVEQPLRDLYVTQTHLSADNLLESYHDAQQAMDMAIQAFASGYLPLAQRSLAERLFGSICNRIQRESLQLAYIPEELRKLDLLLSETYYCNFSVFQSLPDSWAIKQLFPVMPIHRLDEEPTHRAVLGDITCDSDGKIEDFVDRQGSVKTLPLHTFNHEPYQLGVFLVGAYQEILGDLHNLFGDTNAVHVGLNEQNKVAIESVVKGDSVSEVLHYVQFNCDELTEKFQRSIETAVRRDRIDDQDAGSFLRFYESGLRGYTYLD